MARMDTDVGGYGIPAIPTLPTQGVQQSLLHQTTATPPTECTERTEPSCRERTPTDGTDAHRCRRVWHSCHTHAAKFCVFCEFCGRTAHHNNLCPSVPSVGEKIFPQNARNTRNLLAEKSLPQMSTDVHRLEGYGIPAIPTLPNSVFCWRTAHSKHLCKSVKSVEEKIFPQNARNSQKLLAEKSLPQMAQMRTDVGGHLSRRFCEFGVFRGRISHSRRRGYGKMPYPPKEESAGGHLIKL